MSSKVLLLCLESQPIINGLLDEFKYQSLSHWPTTQFITHNLSSLNKILCTISEDLLQQQLKQEIQSVDYLVFATTDHAQFDWCTLQAYIKLFESNQNIPAYMFVVSNQQNGVIAEQLEERFKQILSQIGIVMNITFININNIEQSKQSTMQNIKLKITQLMRCD